MKILQMTVVLLAIAMISCKKNSDPGLPKVSSTDPINNGVNISRDQQIVFTFNQAMNPSTINDSTFFVMQGGTLVPGTVVYSGSKATFTPTTLLAPGTTYTATMTTDAKNPAGIPISANTVWNFTTGGSQSTLAVVNLGEAGNYVIVGETEIKNATTSTITGDLGLSPAATSYVTGFSLTKATGYATSTQVTGKIYAADMAAPTPNNMTTAVNNMLTAYTDAAGRPSPDFTELGTGNLGGRTLVEGLYKWTNTVTIPSDVTISGGPNDVWIFQIAGNLTMSSALHINLMGGAVARNIFWQVAGEATIGTTSHFEGVLLSKTGITLQTGASFNGKILAQSAVILDANTITNPQ